jgi:hypothetical protein
MYPHQSQPDFFIFAGGFSQAELYLVKDAQNIPVIMIKSLHITIINSGQYLKGKLFTIKTSDNAPPIGRANIKRNIFPGFHCWNP